MNEPTKLEVVKDHISYDEMANVMKLLKNSTSIELKLMVEETAHATLGRLGFDPVDAQPRQTYFFDTPDLALNRAGLIVRARRRAGDRGDTVIKLRPVDPKTINAELRLNASFKVEVDVMPGGYVCSASLKGRCTGNEVDQVIDGGLPLKSIFNQQQRRYYAAHAPSGIAMNDLVPLGPTFLLLLKQQPAAFDRPVVVELWLYPDGSRILEISTKGEPQEGFQLAALFRSFLADCGIPVQKATGTKTAKALQYFAKHLPK